MITATIEQRGNYCHVGNADIDENIISDCKSEITFDCEGIQVSSVKNGETLCVIFFSDTDKLVKELMAFVAAYDAQRDTVKKKEYE